MVTWCSYCTVFRKKHPLTFFLYFGGKCLDFHKIFRECLGGIKYFTDEKVKYFLLPVMSCWRHIFVFANYGPLPLKTYIWSDVNTHQLIIVLTEPQNMLIHHIVFHCELFCGLFFFCWMWDSQLFYVGRRMCTAWMTTCSPSSNGLILPVVRFLFKIFIPSLFNCLSIVHKHFAQTCGSITLADLQTFDQMSVQR